MRGYFYFVNRKPENDSSHSKIVHEALNEKTSAFPNGLVDQRSSLPISGKLMDIIVAMQTAASVRTTRSSLS
ncbi:hypothetical protein SAMN04487926_15731 [Paraburkholderia steynii]|uniref:Uncharacterized protein n=1 Tax=Paraburkholderia steynii TaxID=1245441 RepID=A0A7Z7BLA3_9BURK|nr:hypothetical protein SAMN04487926_15731 [Paraburkholderia steynii]